MFQYWTPPIRRLPPLLWVRIRADLASYLVDRGADGTQLICWYHRQFVEAAVDRYLSDPIERKSRHSAIADYFLGRNFVGERKLQYFLLISYPDLLSAKPKARSNHFLWLARLWGSDLLALWRVQFFIICKVFSRFCWKMYIFSPNK